MVLQLMPFLPEQVEKCELNGFVVYVVVGENVGEACKGWGRNVKMEQFCFGLPPQKVALLSPPSIFQIPSPQHPNIVCQ